MPESREKRSTDVEASARRVCSFCRKSSEEVGPFAEGPGAVYICYPCVRLCSQIIEQTCRQRGIPIKKFHP